MKNVTMTVVGDKLTIEVDLSKRHGLSSSKKSVIIASTGGNVKIGETDYMIGVNAYSQDSKEIESLAKVAEAPKES